MTPEQIEILYELQTAAQDYARLSDSFRHRATYDLACYAGDHLDDASRAGRHASRYRRAAEALVALTTPPAPTGTCGTCAHFLPWDRATLTGTGDCHHPAYKGRRNGMPDDDGCIKGYTPKATP